ncbi:MAG: hypothetical protein RLY16_2147 [Bacteroidota bacterium]|jgi:hypothetical protein
MNIKDALFQEQSKAQRNNIVNWVGKSSKRFAILFACFVDDNHRLAQYASWPLSVCVEQHPHLIEPHFTDLLNRLEDPSQHAAIRRNGIRLLQFITIPEAYQGRVMDICFRFLEHPKSAIAVKAFSIEVLWNLAQIYPEIISEVSQIINMQLDTASPAIRNKAKIFLK